MASRVVSILLPIVVLATACGIYRAAATVPACAQAPVTEGHDAPVRIAPRHNLAAVATDEQLAEVLDRMRPQASVVDTNYLVHALRLWGAEADFENDAYFSGREMLGYCLDDRKFAELAGSTAPALVTVSSGPRVRRAVTGDPFSATGTVHTDDLLATLAEVGVPLDSSVHGRDGMTTVRDMLETSLAQFHGRQYEYEWTAIAYARYALSDARWTNAQGERLDVDAMVDELIEHNLRQGVCGGTHRLEALAVLLRADETEETLSSGTRRRIRAHLADVVRRLVNTQHSNGYWTKDWADGSTGHHATRGNDSQEAPSAERILATGHHLEWLALVPEDLLPPRETIVRAGQWLVRAMLEVDDATLQTEFGPFSHAARALCLWRGAEPWTVWQATQANAGAADART